MNVISFLIVASWCSKFAQRYKQLLKWSLSSHVSHGRGQNCHIKRQWHVNKPLFVITLNSDLTISLMLNTIFSKKCRSNEQVLLTVSTVDGYILASSPSSAELLKA
jgi:hypothetical protein